ncbi:hypothetical protein MFIFM68171_08378 [Madurella fahalii]|uniref:Uncharacterized protein n=1 Tax=Madurella fahalii TaxID=1157608 RepID=A0ABQ0GK90_9PEZI
MLELQSILTRLSFSENGQYPGTDRRLLRITSSPNASSSAGNQKPASTFLFIDNDWVTQNGKSVLWLPADYRATCAAIFGHTLVLGHASGQITFFRFASAE